MYDKDNSTLFRIEKDDIVRTWPLANTKKVGLEYLQRTLYLKDELIAYEVRKIPWSMKRSKHDHAKLLILYFENGKILAKRHSNSQFLSL